MTCSECPSQYECHWTLYMYLPGNFDYGSAAGYMFSYEEWTNARIPSKILVMWLNESFVVLLLSLLRLVDTVLLTYQ